jgi:hypothetical protein
MLEYESHAYQNRPKKSGHFIVAPFVITGFDVKYIYNHGLEICENGLVGLELKAISGLSIWHKDCFDFSPFQYA